MWVQSSDPIKKGQPTWPVHMMQIPPSWASYLPFPALPCCWKRVGDHQTRLGFLQVLSWDKEVKSAVSWALTPLQGSASSWEMAFLSCSFLPSRCTWSLQTSLSAALYTEMTSLTMPFLLFLQAAHFAQTGVLTNSVWTGNITSASQSSFHFP